MSAVLNAPTRRLPSLLAIEAERGRRSFRYFFEHFAWPVLLPGVPFRGNWHIDAMCEHLEAHKRRQIRQLIINIPTRHLKSTICTQAFMAWDWIDDPHLTYVTASYKTDLAVRDAVNTRRIIQSPKYQAAYGTKFHLMGDQNVKERYDNSRGGYRISVGVDAGVTGFGGNRRIVDDPANPEQANNPNAVLAGVEWWKGSFSSRINDPMTDTVLVVQQRLSMMDLTGYLLGNEKGWEQLIIPLRYEREHTKTTSLGWVDPRKVERQVIQPERYDEASTVQLENNLGTYHSSAQLQQRPHMRGGVILDRSKFKFWKVLPQLQYVILSVDCSFKALQTSDRVAIQGWGVAGANRYLLPNRLWERLSFTGTKEAVRAQRALYPQCMAVLIEDKANGPAVIDSLTGTDADSVPGVTPVTPDGGKAARAYACQPELEAGNIWVPDPSIDPTIEVFLQNCANFTGADGAADDEQDAMTQALNWLRARFRSMGLQLLMQQEYEQQRAKAAMDALKAQA